MRSVSAYLAALLLCAPLFAQESDGGDLAGELLDAVQDMADEKYDAAADRLRSIVARDSSFDAAYYYLGQCSYYSGQPEEAEAYFLEACRLDTANNWYLESLAQLYSATGKVNRSGELYLKLLSRDPARYRNPYTLTLLADEALTRDEDSLALSYYSQALLYDSQYIPALLGKADTHRYRGEFSEFFDAIGQFVSDESILPEPKCRYLTTLLGTFDPRTFRSFRERILALGAALAGAHPDFAVAREINMEILAYYQMWPEVISECEAMIAIDPRDSAVVLSCYSLLGDVKYQTGDRKGAFDAYEKALKVNPRHLPVLNNYAYYLSQEGKNLRKALKMSKITIEEEPDNATYLDTYGWILHLLRRSKEAKPYFKHAMLYGGKDSAVILAHYSLVLEALGEKELASYYRGLAESK